MRKWVKKLKKILKHANVPGRESIYWKWLFLYLAIMLVLILCNSITYWHSRKILIDNQNMENDKMAELVSGKLTDILGTMEDLVYSTVTLEEVSLLGREPENIGAMESYARYTLFEKLGKYKKINGNYSEILLYFCNDDYIVSSDSSNTSRNYWRTYKEKYGNITWEQWTELMQGTYHSLSMQTGNDDVVFFVKTIQENKWDRAQINIIFMYNQSELRNLLFLSDSADSRFVLQHQAGEVGLQVLWDSQYWNLEDEDKICLQNAFDKSLYKEKLPLLNQDVFMRYYELGAGYRVIIYWFDSVYFSNIRDYQGKIMFLLIGSIAASILIMFYFLRRNYSQVAMLLDLLKITMKDTKESNEFKMIGGRLTQIQQNLKEADNRLERQNNMFCQEYLKNLLKGNIPKDADYLEDLYRIKWCGEQFTTLLFFTEDIGRDGSSEWKRVHDKNLDLELVQFIFANVCQELFRDRDCVIYKLIVSDMLVMLVNFSKNDKAENRNIVLEVVTQIQTFMDTHLDIRYMVASGEICEGREGIGDAYQESIYVMEMKRMYELDEYLFYSDMQMETNFGYYYPIEVERELIRQIRMQNIVKAEEIITKLYDENEKDNVGNMQEIIRYLSCDIWCTMLKALEGARSIPECSNFFKAERGGKKELLDALQVVCECLKNDKENDFQNDEEMCEKIVQYVQQNIADSNLSVSSIAEYFQLPSVDMSRTFRNIRGQKLPTYISMLRIQRVKKILSSSDCGLNDVAEMAGFGSVRTLLRCFKQSEGMTPSQWKDRMQEH